MSELERITTGDTSYRAMVRANADADAGVVVLHAWWGLNEDALAYAERLAGEGFAVLAPDMFDGNVATTPEQAEKLSGQAEGSGAPESIAYAAIDELAGRLGTEARIAILGFSFGAAYAILAPSERQRVAATVAYYGTYTGSFIARSTAAFLGHYAENDPYESAESVEELEQQLRDAGRDTTVHRYPGTGHWFAEPSKSAYNREAAELAYARTVDFLNRVVRRS